MANLSDLDTTQIGIIAFWNAHDHRVVAGVGNVNPTDCISIFDSYDVYDNGIEGYKALGSGRRFHARVKTDGWMVAWIDRTNTFSFPSKPSSEFGEAGKKGFYDILYEWFQYTTYISSTYTKLSYLISLLYNALANKANFTFTAADVGHYCYMYPSANVLTMISLQTTYNEAIIGYVKYTPGTNLYYAAVCGVAYYSGSSLSFAGNTLAAGADPATYGVANIITQNWMPNPLTDYGLDSATAGNINRKAHGSILILWT